MAFGKSAQEQQISPPVSFSNEKQAHGSGDVRYDEDLHAPCPAHTTESALVRKIDLYVVPFLCVLYLLAFLDRVNIANAKVYGMTTELGLVGNQYSVALVIFFVPYVFFEIPSNMLLKKFSPNVWLSVNMFLFGFVTIMQVSHSSFHREASLLVSRE